MPVAAHQQEHVVGGGHEGRQVNAAVARRRDDLGGAVQGLGGDGGGGYGDGNAWEREGNIARAYSEPAVVLKRARGRSMATKAKTAVGEEEVVGLAAVAPFSLRLVPRE